MDTHIRSELNHIKADDELVSKTEVYLKNELAHNHKAIRFSKHRLAFIRDIAKIACIVLILIQSEVGRFAYYKTPVSYISLDINPSIEFGVNIFDRVVSAEGYNGDGKNVLAGLNVTGTNVVTAIRTVISSAINNGFVESDGSTVISVTSETDDTKTAQKLESETETGVNKALEEKGRTAVVVKDNVRLALRDEARELSITPGKLNLIKKLQAVDSLATIDQYRDEKVKEIMAATQEYADSNTNNTRDETAINSQKKDDLSSQKEDAATKKEQNIAKHTDESTVSSKDNSTEKNKGGSTAGSKDNNIENNKGESVTSSKDKNTGKNKNENSAKSKDESAANSKDKGTNKSEGGNNLNNKTGQVVNEQAVYSNQEAAVSNNLEVAKSDGTEKAAGNVTTVREWLERNNTKNAVKIPKK